MKTSGNSSLEGRVDGDGKSQDTAAEEVGFERPLDRLNRAPDCGSYGSALESLPDGKRIETDYPTPRHTTIKKACVPVAGKINEGGRWI